MATLARITVLFTLVNLAAGYKVYQQDIPNGDAVPHPCKPNHVWAGVGHFLDAGTGHRNPFGQDFEKEGKVWSNNLCIKDSDGDGKTNGQELGDPDCKWTKTGNTALQLTGLSHPGVCDPWNSPLCLSKVMVHPKFKTQEEWMLDMCKDESFVCPVLNDTGIKNLDLTIPPETKVPGQVTTYMCKMFNFESMVLPGDYHLVAVEPVLNNTYVIHHIALFGCSDDADVTSEPFECGMVPSQSCMTTLSIWTVGLNGECFHPKTGITLGSKGYKRLAIQLHWNNPDKRTSWTDSSGLRLHYTLNKRPFEAGILMTGLRDFVLPPRQQSIRLMSPCTSTCTRALLKGSIFITQAWNHMHYAGASVSVEVIRGNSSSTFLSRDEPYSYDSPHVLYYTDNPVEVIPGDTIVTRCEYTTMKRTTSTVWGEATNDEMCFGFLTFYPKENLVDDCTSVGPDVLYCDSNTFRGCADLLNYYNESFTNTTTLYADLTQNCSPYGPCLVECKEVILAHRKVNPCLKDEIFEYIKQHIWSQNDQGRLLSNLFSSCDIEIYKTLNADKAVTTAPCINEAQLLTNHYIFYATIFVLMFL